MFKVILIDANGAKYVSPAMGEAQAREHFETGIRGRFVAVSLAQEQGNGGFAVIETRVAA